MTVNVTCVICGIDFPVPPSQAKRRQTCSMACRDELHRRRIANGELTIGRSAWSEETKAQMAASAEVKEVMQRMRRDYLEATRAERDKRNAAQAEREQRKLAQFNRLRKEADRYTAYLRHIGEIMPTETYNDYTARLRLVPDGEYKRATELRLSGLLPMPDDWQAPEVAE